MGFSKEFREQIEQRLSTVCQITTRAMFGGVGIYSDGFFFALIAEDKLYFKVNPNDVSEFTDLGMGPFFPFESPKPMHYYEVPESILSNPQELKLWVDRAVAIARSKKEQAQPKKGRRPV